MDVVKMLLNNLHFIQHICNSLTSLRKPTRFKSRLARQQETVHAQECCYLTERTRGL